MVDSNTKPAERKRPAARKVIRDPSKRQLQKMNPAVPMLLVDINGVAKMLSVSIPTVKRRVKAGQLPQPIRFEGTMVRWRISDIENYVGGAV